MKKRCFERRFVFVLAALSFAGPGVAQDCGAPPQGSGPAWWQQYADWCSACGGQPNAGDMTCVTGAGWGRAPGAAVAAPPAGAVPEDLAGQWTMTLTCGGDSASYTFTIESVTDGALAVTGDIGNCGFDAGRIDGNRVTMTCSNWLNKLEYQGTLAGVGRMKGTFSQRLRRGPCQWGAVKAGAAAQAEPAGAADPVAAGASQDAAAGDAFVGTITKGNFAKGWGFSIINMKIVVTAADGEEKVFFIREDSLIAYPDGSTTNVRKMTGAIKGRKVAIRHAPIQDDTGGVAGGSGFAYEIGKNGVLTLRFVD